jgi:hypothetical protein
MATYTLKLTAQPINLASEGGLDSSVVSGVSKQRSGYIETVASGARKVSEIDDGATFTDVVQTLVTIDNGDGSTYFITS